MSSRLSVGFSGKWAALLIPGAAALMGASAWAGSCDPTLLHSYDQASKYVSGLHLDKPSQMRVVASDGAVYTAGEVLWLRGQLRDVSKACVAGQSDIATTRLNDVESALQFHQVSTPD